MNKDELRIRIIPEDGQLLIETHTDGIVKCKEIQEDALLDCIKNSAMRDYVNSGLLPSDCIHVKHPAQLYQQRSPAAKLPQRWDRFRRKQVLLSVVSAVIRGYQLS